MKKTSFMLGSLTLLCALCLLNGCEKPNEMTLKPMVVVLKMKKPEYKDNILVNYHKGDSVIQAMRFNQYGEPAGKSGYSPYWELPDNWLLVDWKWRGFPYDAGLTLLTELTWEKYPTYTGLPLPTWPLSEPHVFQPLEKGCYVSGKKLAEYSNDDNIQYRIDGMMHVTFAQPNVVQLGDSIWTIVQSYLSTAIENGDLEKLSLN